MTLTQLLISLIFLFPISAIVSAPAPFPNPVIFLRGTEVFEAAGKTMTRYRFSVDNRSAYPNELFAPSPDLPPCEKNNKASRTWVDIYDQRGTRLNGFCAFAKSDDLNGLWFALDSSAVPPSWVYIEMIDRKANIKLKSNLAETTP